MDLLNNSAIEQAKANRRADLRAFFARLVQVVHVIRVAQHS